MHDDAYGLPNGEGEIAQVGELIAEAFGFPPSFSASWFAYAGLENLRRIRDGQSVGGGLLLIPMGQFWGGRAVKLCGFAGVATKPEARGRGLGTRMMAAALGELRHAGWPLAGLYPATQALYRRVGFEQAGVRVEHRGPITALPVFSRELAMRAFVPGDLPAVQRVYTRAARHRNGWLDRGPYIWHRVQHPRQLQAHGYVVAPQGGGIEGYVFLQRVQKPNGRIDVNVVDMAAATPRALERLVTFLRDHESLAEDVVFFGGGNDGRLSLLREQRLVSHTVEAWMIRVLHVERALVDRGYPRGLSATLHLEIHDELFPENSGRFVLEVSGGEGRVRRGGDGALRCDVRQLAALYSGFRSATTLNELGLIDATEEACEVADALFLGEPPSTPDVY